MNLPRSTQLPAVQKQSSSETKGFEYGGLKDEFSPARSNPGATQGFDIEQRKANSGFEYGGLATPKK
ncbi:MAG: hypothetical protein QM723_01310 [Myxococcaceae bacterium]